MLRWFALLLYHLHTTTGRPTGYNTRMQEQATLNRLLDDWFGPAEQRSRHNPEHYQLWFSSTPEQDAELRKNWAGLHLEAVRGELTHWCFSPQARLGLILLLDQLPRVFYRSTPKAFAYDGQALALTLAGIDAGQDKELALHERAFFYMPLQHSEDLAAQRISIRCNQQLAEAFPDNSDDAENYLKFAKLHYDIIEQFGRYPHRNRILGRASNERETEWLNSGDSQSFGQ